MSNELYIVEENGKLSIRRCPFDVIANETVANIKNGKIYSVSTVHISVRNETVFKIDGSYYLYKSFDI